MPPLALQELQTPNPKPAAYPELIAPPPTTDVSAWVPNAGPQEFALMQPDTIFEILYGGARGGGKTDAGIVWIGEHFNHPRYRALVIRKNADDLSDWVDRAVRMYAPWGATAAYRPAEIRFPSGALIKTGHLKDRNSYTKYQGHEYQRMLIEELNQIAQETHYTQLIASCRSTVPGLSPQIFCTTNPGGIGHSWVKKRFVSGHRRGWPFFNTKTGRKSIFIPASVDDNPVLMIADPGYVHLLDGLKETDEQLWKAWRLGDWDVFIGQMFSEWNYNWHTYGGAMDYPIELCRRIMTFDWGYSAPGVMLWLAITPENAWGVRRVFVYRELHLTKHEPEEWAIKLAKINAIDPVEYMALPHDVFAQARGKQTIASTFSTITGIRQVRMPTLAKNARLNRAALLHRYLNVARDRRPYLQVHRSCRNTIETIPELVHDENNIEDVDTRGPDHCYDALTGGLLTMYATAGGSGTITPQAQQKVDLKHWHPNEQGALESPDFGSEFDRLKRLGRQ